MNSDAFDFDADWYVATYPDVSLCGMNPYEHFLWIGRRLGRHGRASSLEGPEDTAQESQRPTPRPAATDRYGNEAIEWSLRTLVQWLLADPNSILNDQILFEKLAPDFWNSLDGDVITKNPVGRLLVDFMADFKATFDEGSGFPLPQSAAPPCKNILLTSFYAPTFAHAGGLRILDVYAEIRNRHPDVHLTLFTPRHESVDGDLSILNEIFHEIHFCEPENFRFDYLADRLGDRPAFDLVDLQFHQAGAMANDFRKIGKHLIFTPMEVLSRFEFDVARSKISKGLIDTDKIFSLIHRGVEEIEIMRNVDMTVCVSDADAAFLHHISGESAANYFPTGLSSGEFARELGDDYSPPEQAKKKRRLVYAAYFGSETNVIGLEWFLKNVHPRLLQECEDYDLAVVGRGDTSRLQALNAPSVCFIGEVPNLAPVLEQARAGLVLALNGSGFRGKINQYALCGVPAVSTSLGATGLTYESNEDILIADTPAEFAAACLSLLNEDELAQRLATAARTRALSAYSWGGIWPRVASIYRLGEGWITSNA